MENKRNKIVVALIVLIIIFLSVMFFCLKDENKQVLKEYDSRTGETSQYEYFLKNGDTVLEGKYTQYDKEGKKIAEGNYINNHLKGKFITYFENANIKAIHYVLKGKLNAESIEYYSNGKIKRYVMFDPLGLEAFIARYDEIGLIKNYDGYPLMEIYQYKFANKKQFGITVDQFLKNGDTLKYNYIVANIPNTKRSFKIENLGLDNTIIKRIEKKLSPTEVEIKEVLIKKGINTIRATIQYKFNDKATTVVNDTITFQVEVH
nr:hypothetical protein [uncultured Flavobacterium sp.]